MIAVHDKDAVFWLSVRRPEYQKTPFSSRKSSVPVEQSHLIQKRTQSLLEVRTSISHEPQTTDGYIYHCLRRCFEQGSGCI
jgi:hypothetical protein